MSEPEAAARRAVRSAGSLSLRDRILILVGGTLLFVVLRVLGWTTRKDFTGPGAEELLQRFAGHEPSILAFWHGRMVMMPFAYRGPGACIMNSRHRDGQLISRAIELLGIEVVRGSSTRGWVGGMRGLLAAHARGRDLVIVPDGPRGPRCRAKSGAVQLARATGAPIFPVAYAASRARVLSRSWDWLCIPLPGAHVTYIVEEPIRVSRDTAPATLEAARVALEERLNRAVRQADRACGVAPEHTLQYIEGVAHRLES
ncbi:MAG: lysophospholipid acyltransferase family protein [Thermodesulfobacteriota bacterium]